MEAPFISLPIFISNHQIPHLGTRNHLCIPFNLLWLLDRASHFSSSAVLICKTKGGIYNPSFYNLKNQKPTNSHPPHCCFIRFTDPIVERGSGDEWSHGQRLRTYQPMKGYANTSATKNAETNQFAFVDCTALVFTTATFVPCSNFRPS